MTKENKWGSNLSFILAMIGSAVGLGNIWRYPYVLYYNGGGAFYIPYIVAILVVGLSFLFLEYGVGYHFSSSFAKAIKNINSKYEFLGWFIPVSVFMLMIYYTAIIGWDGIYVILSFFKGWGADPNNFFTNTLLQSTTSPSGLFTFVPIIAVSTLVGWFIVWSISHRDLESGLGKASKFLVPVLFIIMIIVVVISLLLPGASIGLKELFNPNWPSLFDFGIWLGAFGQIVFSLSLGMSIAFTYASYTEDGTDLISNTLIVAFANCLFENFAALGVFSILGYMSLQSGVGVEQLVAQGPGLIFIVYPTVFNVLGYWSSILGPMFFIAVYIAGITSLFSTLEPLSYSIQNKFGLSRKKAITILCIFGAVMSMIFATAYGETLLDTVDTFINQIAIIFAVIMECIIFAWIFKAENLIDYLNSHSKSIKLGQKWLIMVKYIVPVFLMIIWVGGIFDMVMSESSTFVVIMIATAILLILSTFIFTRLPSKNPDWDVKEERF